MTRQTSTTSARHGEKGAALVISILIATLLLAVAGTVILTSGMSATTSIEGTAELQAYYAAETGLEDTLNVLRGHVAPHGLPSTTRINFRNAVDPEKSNHPSDDSGVARLSAWLDYDSDDWRVTPTAEQYAYSVVVIDPDDPDGAKRNADATYKPTRIQVQSIGYGPKGSTKRMEMIVQKTFFEFSPQAMLLMRGADSGAAMTFDIGDSGAKFYSGHDNAGTPTNLPTFGVTHAADKVVADNAITKGATVEEVSTLVVDFDDLPSWLKTADNARAFLNDLQLAARSMGRYFTSFSGIAGTTADPKFTFVNGNATLDGGAGLMVVTGNLIMNGNPTFNGVILVLGEGTINRDGGGNGNVLGSIYVAKFARSWPSAENGLPHPFLAPAFHTSGGGTANLEYDSVWVEKAKDAVGDIVRDIREY
ncbi:MAG TPA: pilus assembly PilX N-terminal domain-containing protein [Pyrinomonadaceae bacterium]|nr:pilus assembly PilX N-terminal domain-containing protein [Pyrinomonadaceae bacterium]